MGVFGTGPAAQGFFAFTIAGNGPNGTNQTYVARATCLVVAANTATATGIIFYPSTSAGQRVVMQAVDNGGGNPPRDLLRFSFAGFIHQDPSDPTGRCWIPTLPPAPIDSGHIIVGHTPSESGGNGG